MVKQNIVFVENTPGSLQKVTRILAENQIDIYGFGCFDAPEFANFRMVCDNPEKADEIIAEQGYMTRITQAILVDLQDEIGGLDKLLSVMGDSNVNLHYIYTFFHRGLKYQTFFRSFLAFHMSANSDPFAFIDVITLFYSVKHQIFSVIFYVA